MGVELDWSPVLICKDKERHVLVLQGQWFNWTQLFHWIIVQWSFLYLCFDWSEVMFVSCLSYACRVHDGCIMYIYTRVLCCLLCIHGFESKFPWEMGARLKVHSYGSKTKQKLLLTTHYINQPRKWEGCLVFFLISFKKVKLLSEIIHSFYQVNENILCNVPFFSSVWNRLFLSINYSLLFSDFKFFT